ENRVSQHRRSVELRLKRAQLEAVEAEIAMRMDALRRDLDTKRAEIELFEAESVAELEAADTFQRHVRRLRAADEPSTTND
ncbi:MAG TPA: hypothetical protein VF021_10330, partial [Longimicrobiales bacterium]